MEYKNESGNGELKHWIQLNCGEGANFHQPPKFAVSVGKRNQLTKTTAKTNRTIRTHWNSSFMDWQEAEMKVNMQAVDEDGSSIDDCIIMITEPKMRAWIDHDLQLLPKYSLQTMFYMEPTIVLPKRTLVSTSDVAHYSQRCRRGDVWSVIISVLISHQEIETPKSLPRSRRRENCQVKTGLTQA